MPKYLFQGNYSAEGAKGLLKEGGSKRVQVIREAVEAIGGKLEAMYFAFGDADVFLIADMPDHASVTALSLTAAGSGVVGVKTTVLITPEEVDEASKKSVVYTPPGQ